MISKPLLNIGTIWMIFIKIFKSKIQIKKRKLLIVFADMLRNKKLIH